MGCKEGLCISLLVIFSLYDVVFCADVDPQFSSFAARIATEVQSIQSQIPHGSLPDTVEGFQNLQISYDMPYVKDMAKVIGPGFAISFIMFIAAIVFCIYKICQKCSKKKKAKKPVSFAKKLVPSLFYIFFLLFLIFGMTIGFSNSPIFSKGVNSIATNVINTDNASITLGNDLVDGVQSILNSIPISVNQIMDQTSGIPTLADSIVILGGKINSTSSQLNSIRNSISQINAWNNTVVAQFYAAVNSLTSESIQATSDVADLTQQIAQHLNEARNESVENMKQQLNSVEENAQDFINTANSILDQATTVQSNVNKWVDYTTEYDSYRDKATPILFAVVTAVAAMIALGFLCKFKCIFSLVAVLGMFLSTILWLGGSTYFGVGMVMTDMCPRVDIIVKALTNTSSQEGVVLQGCLTGSSTVLESLNVTAYNLTELNYYKEEFINFRAYTESFNFSTVEGVLSSTAQIYMYNLTFIAANMTVASFGWNPANVYVGLAKLNDATYPYVFSLDNYTSADPNNYPPPQNNTVAQAKSNLAYLINMNETVYEELSKAQTQLVEVQGQVDALRANVATYEKQYYVLKSNITTLSSVNVSNCINIIGNVEDQIGGFMDTGNCSFVGTAYNDTVHALCYIMQPAVNLLTVAQFVGGLALIPLVILAGVLGRRIPALKKKKKKGKGGKYRLLDDTGSTYGAMETTYEPQRSRWSSDYPETIDDAIVNYKPAKKYKL